MSSQIPLVPPFIAITKATEPARGFAGLDFQIKQWHIAAGVPGIIFIIVAIWYLRKLYMGHKRTGQYNMNPFA